MKLGGSMHQSPSAVMCLGAFTAQAACLSILFAHGLWRGIAGCASVRDASCFGLEAPQLTRHSRVASPEVPRIDVMARTRSFARGATRAEYRGQWTRTDLSSRPCLCVPFGIKDALASQRIALARVSARWSYCILWLHVLAAGILAKRLGCGQRWGGRVSRSLGTRTKHMGGRCRPRRAGLRAHLERVCDAVVMCLSSTVHIHFDSRRLTICTLSRVLRHPSPAAKEAAAPLERALLGELSCRRSVCATSPRGAGIRVESPFRCQFGSGVSCGGFQQAQSGLQFLAKRTQGSSSLRFMAACYDCYAIRLAVLARRLTQVGRPSHRSPL